MKVIEIDKTVSTQDEIKKYIGGGFSVAVFASEQTGGRGTKGRSFYSRPGGVYASFIVGWRDLDAANAFRATIRFSLAVVKTLEIYKIKPTIKWPNDIYVGDKKICGMLIENHVKNGFIDYTVAGVGINVNNVIGEDLKEIATSTEIVLNKKIDERKFFYHLVQNVEREYPDFLYKRYSCVLGKRIKVVSGDKEYFDVAKDILPDGRLVLESGQTLSAEEISLKI